MRTFTTWSILGALAIAAAAACSSGPGGTTVIVVREVADSGSTTVPPWSGSGSGSGGGMTSPDGGGAISPPGEGGTSAATGVPCDVATMLASMCTSCHSDPPSPSALAGLVTYADLMATSHEDSTKNEAQVSLARMQSTTSPMPPGAPPPTADVTTLKNWIAAGYPKGSCGGGGVGGGGEAGAPPPPAKSVFTGAPPFSSMTGRDTHNAGRDCLQCHSGGGGDANSFSFGGTLYDGSGNPVVGAEVRLVDSSGAATSVYTSSTGTFYSEGNGFAAPAHVGVRNGTSPQDMAEALQSTTVGPASTGGACSACHCTGTGCTVGVVHLP